MMAQEQTTLATEQAHASSLAQQAANLKDLIARMETRRRAGPACGEQRGGTRARIAGAPAKPSLAALQDPEPPDAGSAVRTGQGNAEFAGNRRDSARFRRR